MLDVKSGLLVLAHRNGEKNGLKARAGHVLLRDKEGARLCRIVGYSHLEVKYFNKAFMLGHRQGTVQIGLEVESRLGAHFF